MGRPGRPSAAFHVEQWNLPGRSRGSSAGGGERCSFRSGRQPTERGPPALNTMYIVLKSGARRGDFSALWVAGDGAGRAPGRESAWTSIDDPGGITVMSAGSRSGATNTPGRGDSREESTPVRGSSSGRSALHLTRRLRPLPGSGAGGPGYRWCRRLAPQPAANGSGSLRDGSEDQA